jgi:hypothetical protein
VDRAQEKAMTARPRRGAAAGLALGAMAGSLAGCYHHVETPGAPPQGPLAGRAPPAFDRSRACGHWSDALGPDGGAADVHDTFPELFAAACYVPVRYDGERALPDATPEGCGYPAPSAKDRLTTERARYARIAAGALDEPLPSDLACELPPGARVAAARQNEKTLGRVLADLAEHKTYPYAAVAAFGFGHRDQAESVLHDFKPGDACRPMSKADLDLLTVNVTRAGRAAMAHEGRVAPVVLLSGGAVHSSLIEAFALAHLAQCRFHVAADRVLVDPCADHTHTNLKHTASLVVALGGRSAYVVTDDGLQSGYLEEWNVFNLIGGSIDQRALRDWGYLLGSWRRASIGMRAGFWFSPFRFWAEPQAGLGSFNCTR